MYGDYAWGKDGHGFSENWVRNNVSQEEVYVVELEGTPVATFSLVLDEDKHWGPQEPIAGYVHGLSVRKDFNGRGLGSFMLDWCGDKISALNRRFIRLDCAGHNAKLCAYYESLGFIRVGQYAEPEAGGYVWSLYEKSANPLRKRPSARLPITTPKRRVLLFRFAHKSGPLAGKAYWATPGGGVEHGETFADAAIRELREETGIRKARLSQPVGRRELLLQLPDGEDVFAVEQYFVVDTDTESISRDSWTADEKDVMADHQWWSREELSSTTETIYPEGLVQMLDNAGIFSAERPL
ncbi:bifunctional GNAT family N-acetyltransferase/NUDIX hydrolase [Paraburkholderia strydomiana]|uniref:bifunctional GNAT family N-acetyltransferase/NUDIX hydrolase n=1 Tax=Paraburkholderia strydomiana TaxID=1245417 RepID=UPI002859FC03|nr:bifunctional GNAT family N-acetyltransferase/NUDIX hydrolase [Paraburkholderia strydomiana]MDR7008988.1 8-oxo-dGTP pyrophosphatase MutT (NUDIX family)/GNAT superfamily N-acetyltransferase [Paraburkholderia strydomiana]